MEQQYGISDLRQYINERSFFQPISQPPDLLSGHRHLAPVQHYPEMVLMPEMVPPGGGFHPNFRTDHSTAAGMNVTCGMSGGGYFGGLETEGGGGGGLAGDGGTGRWPRQETLTLLEIRSRLDSKFKEANQKGPLWEEVSRIMSEEHGYQRSGKKCREKFENLYKYYKKTKAGKAGRQDGKHYRFFRQLEALYGETSNAATFSDNHNLQSTFPYNNSSAANNSSAVVSNQEALQGSKVSVDSLSFSNSSNFYSSSSEDATVDNESFEKRRKRKGKKNWKVKIKDFIDSHMRKLVEKQEVWVEKMMRTIEEKEKERLKREDEWRKQQAVRIEREQKFWANEKAWIEAHDASLMECLREITGKEIKPYQPQHQNMSFESLNDGGLLEMLLSSSAKEDHSLSEHEITRLIQLRTSMEPRFQQMRCPEEVIWEEIAAKMACLGYDRSGSMYKEKWDCISNYFIKSNSKKRKEDSRSCSSLVGESMNSQVGEGSYSCSGNEHWLGSLRRDSPKDDDGTGSAMPYGGYRYLLGDAGNLWDNYGVKFSKGENR